jgi:hypothetical protein
MFFRKKHAEHQPAPPQRIQIEFRPTDDFPTRARNIWRALGFANDRLGHVPHISALLEMYAAWDKGEEPPPNCYTRAADDDHD